MPSGIPIQRQWILALKNGSFVIDWGEGLYQDILTGDFESSVDLSAATPITDDELNLLRRAGRVDSFDLRQVYVRSLPERPHKPID